MKREGTNDLVLSGIIKINGVRPHYEILKMAWIRFTISRTAIAAAQVTRMQPRSRATMSR